MSATAVTTRWHAASHAVRCRRSRHHAPGRDGLSVLRQCARAKTPRRLASFRARRVNERVEGLNAGADDYLPKPFETGELVARVRALTRRGGENKSTVLRAAI